MELKPESVSHRANSAGCQVESSAKTAGPLSGLLEIAIKSMSMFDGYRIIRQRRWKFCLTGGTQRRYGYEGRVRRRQKKDIIIVAVNNVYPEDVEM
jgi:hypothetical protein